MPGANLTRIEAEERKSVIAAPVHYTVKLDLTRGAKNFGSETTITFDAEPGATSFLDLIATEVSEIVLNGETLRSVRRQPYRTEEPRSAQRSDRQGTVPVFQHR